MSTKNLAIMFTDIKGFTAKTSSSTKEEVVALLERHEWLMAPIFGHFDGTIVKTIGDAYLVHFDDAAEAVMCGIAIQEVLRQHNAASIVDEQLHIRVSVHWGEVELRDGDVFGETVNITARLEGITGAGEVYLTEAALRAARREGPTDAGRSHGNIMSVDTLGIEIPIEEIGERTFKGIPFPVRVHRVAIEDGSRESDRFESAIRIARDGPVIKGLRATAQGGGGVKLALLSKSIVETPDAKSKIVMPLKTVARLAGAARTFAQPAPAFDLREKGKWLVWIVVLLATALLYAKINRFTTAPPSMRSTTPVAIPEAKQPL